MKQFFLFLTAFCISLFFVFGCTEKNQMSDEDVHPAEFEGSQLIQDLTSLNNHFFDECATTKGLNKGEFIIVAGNDIDGAWKGGKVGGKLGTELGTCLGNPITGSVFGAFLGGVIWGATRSWVAAQGMSLNSHVLEYNDVASICGQALNSDLSINLNNIDEDCLSQAFLDIEDDIINEIHLSQEQINLGMAHNVVLSALEGKLTFKDEPFEGDNTYVDYIIDSDEMSDSFSDVYDLPTNDTATDAKADYVMSLFMEVFESYPDNNYDVANIINGYAQIINASSELTDTEKSCIMGSLATALYSFNYWNNTL